VLFGSLGVNVGDLGCKIESKRCDLWILAVVSSDILTIPTFIIASAFLFKEHVIYIRFVC
jgi:hypothetical protein